MFFLQQNTGRVSVGRQITHQNVALHFSDIPEIFDIVWFH